MHCRFQYFFAVVAGTAVLQPVNQLLRPRIPRRGATINNRGHNANKPHRWRQWEALGSERFASNHGEPTFNFASSLTQKLRMSFTKQRFCDRHFHLFWPCEGIIHGTTGVTFMLCPAAQVVFSRSVIALGADFGLSELPQELVSLKKEPAYLSQPHSRQLRSKCFSLDASSQNFGV